MAKTTGQNEVWIRRYSDIPACDVVVSFRGHEMAVRLPDHKTAVRWARMESKSYNIPARLSDELSA
jgi:hypothetical protein